MIFQSGSKGARTEIASLRLGSISTPPTSNVFAFYSEVLYVCKNLDQVPFNPHHERASLSSL
jgi:hypothetical protein